MIEEKRKRKKRDEGGVGGKLAANYLCERRREAELVSKVGEEKK